MGGHRFRRDHAVVIGGSIAGLLAARVLADHFAQVTIVERDELPDAPRSRRGAPQDGHFHALMAAGSRRSSGWSRGSRRTSPPPERCPAMLRWTRLISCRQGGRRDSSPVCTCARRAAGWPSGYSAGMSSREIPSRWPRRRGLQAWSPTLRVLCAASGSASRRESGRSRRISWSMPRVECRAARSGWRRSAGLYGLTGAGRSLVWRLPERDAHSQVLCGGRRRSSTCLDDPVHAGRADRRAAAYAVLRRRPPLARDRGDGPQAASSARTRWP